MEISMVKRPLKFNADKTRLWKSNGADFNPQKRDISIYPTPNDRNASKRAPQARRLSLEDIFSYIFYLQ